MSPGFLGVELVRVPEPFETCVGILEVEKREEAGANEEEEIEEAEQGAPTVYARTLIGCHEPKVSVSEEGVGWIPRSQVKDILGVKLHFLFQLQI